MMIPSNEDMQKLRNRVHKEFSLEYLLECAKRDLQDLKDSDTFYYTTIDEMMQLEKRIEYIENLLKEE